LDQGSRMAQEELSKLDEHFRIEFGASFSDLHEGETRFVVTARREARRFAGYLLPVWFARLGSKCIVSTTPELRSRVESVLEGFTAEDVFSHKGLSRAAGLAKLSTELYGIMAHTSIMALERLSRTKAMRLLS